MTHVNAPLTPAGRYRLVSRVIVEGRPLAHVAAEAGIARSTLTKWVHRYHHGGLQALQDHSSAPATRPTRLPVEMIELIDTWRRQKKWSARRIHHELSTRGHRCCLRTVSRWLHRLGISLRIDLDPSGENNRHTGPITAAGRASKRGTGRRVGYTYL